MPYSQRSLSNSQAVALPRLGKRKSMRELDLRGCYLHCHPLARDAYLAWVSVEQLTPCLDSIPAHTSALLQLSSVSVVKSKPTASSSAKSDREKIYLFINGFGSIQQLLDQQTLKAKFLVYAAMDDQAIIEYAWFEVVRLIYSNLNTQFGWVSWRHAINQKMPPELTRKFFGRPQLTLRQLSNISGLNIKTLERQRKLYLRGAQ